MGWCGSTRPENERYSQIRLKSRKYVMVHRHVYELLAGPIPEGMELDHKCRVRQCCNPAHLEPVTRAENMERSDEAVIARRRAQTHCKRGHEFTTENTRLNSDGGRMCLACVRPYQAAYQRKLRQRRKES